MNTLLSFKRNKHAIIWRVGIKERNKPSQTTIHTLFVRDRVHTQRLCTHTHRLLLIYVALPLNNNLLKTTCTYSNKWACYLSLCYYCVLTSFLLQILWAQFSQKLRRSGSHTNSWAGKVRSRAVWVKSSPSLLWSSYQTIEIQTQCGYKLSQFAIYKVSGGDSNVHFQADK